MTTDTPVVEGRRRRLKPEERRAELLAAGEQLVRSGGLEALTMEGLATAAGVNRALLYHYFGGWEGLVAALQAKAFAAFRVDLDREIEEREEPIERLRVLARRWLDDSSPERVLLIEYEKVRQAEALDMQRAVQAVESAIAVARLLQEIEPVGEDAALLVAATTLDGATGFIATWRFYDWPLEEAIDRYVALVLGALQGVAGV